MMKWIVSFYSSKVEQQVLAHPKGIRTRLLKTLELIEEYGPDLGLPHTLAMGKGLFEIRAKGQEGIGRYFYITLKREIIILHAYIKKTQKTPKKELDIALSRAGELKL
jgi:phage-related protein